jgi:DNA replication protein DnaC
MGKTSVQHRQPRTRISIHCITTNLPFKQWGSVFPGAACVAALVDRFVQHCHVLDIDADSWRQKSAKASQ